MAYKNKEDERAYQREHYQKNKQLYKDRAAASRPALREQGREYVKKYLLENPCVDCGNSDIRVLQFDHRNPELKTGNIGSMIGSMGLLKREIAKCDVRCANCHMIRTAEQFGWSRAIEDK